MEDRGCPPQAAFITWPRSVQNGQDLQLSMVKFRGGQRHRVILTLRWKPLENEWWLVRYAERPEPNPEGPGTEAF